MLGELRAPGATPLPKGLCKETLELVARTPQGRRTAARARPRSPSSAGLSRVTARRYLEHLVQPQPGRARAALRRLRPPGAPVPLGRPASLERAVPAFRAAYLIHGDDHGRIAERRASLRAMAENAAGTAGVEVYEADQCTPENVASALSAMTFAMGRRFVIADGVERWKDVRGRAGRAGAGSADPETLTVAFFAREEGRYKAPHEAPRRGREGRRPDRGRDERQGAGICRSGSIEQAKDAEARPGPRRRARRSSPRSATASSGSCASSRSSRSSTARAPRSAPRRSRSPAPPRPRARSGRSPTRSSPATARPRSSCCSSCASRASASPA